MTNRQHQDHLHIDNQRNKILNAKVSERDVMAKAITITATTATTTIRTIEIKITADTKTIEEERIMIIISL